MPIKQFVKTGTDLEGGLSRLVSRQATRRTPSVSEGPNMCPFWLTLLVYCFMGHPFSTNRAPLVATHFQDLFSAKRGSYRRRSSRSTTRTAMAPSAARVWRRFCGVFALGSLRATWIWSSEARPNLGAALSFCVAGLPRLWGRFKGKPKQCCCFRAPFLGDVLAWAIDFHSGSNGGKPQGKPP